MLVIKCVSMHAVVFNYNYLEKYIPYNKLVVVRWFDVWYA